MAFNSIVPPSEVSDGRTDTGSPADTSIEQAEAKKKLALESQAKVMAQFHQQQQTFLERQGNIDWGEEDLSESEAETVSTAEGRRNLWKYPEGTCILCQEETNDSRLYGTFAFIDDSNILRQTDLKDSDFIGEAASVPSSLDRSAETIRPFGVASQNREVVRKLTANGDEVITERRGLGKGFPSSLTKHGPVTTGCGHIMHHSCFELYIQATQRRQKSQISRAHPERLDKNEFVCPLCKALGNMFLPIIWKGKEDVNPGILQTAGPFSLWLTSKIGPTVSRLEKTATKVGLERQTAARHQELFINYSREALIAPLYNKIENAIRSSAAQPPSAPTGASATAPNSTFGSEQMETSPVMPANSEDPAIELVSSYRRLRDTMKVNQLATRYTNLPGSSGMSDDLTFTDTLRRTLAFSISAVEIAQRGIRSEPGSLLSDKIPQQALTTLRILSETISSYFAIGAFHSDGQNKTVSEFTETQRRQLHQLFVGHFQIVDSVNLPVEMTVDMKQLDPLLTQDIFNFLAECSVCLLPALHLEIHHVLRLCYIAEVTKVVLAVVREVKPSTFLTNDRYQRLSGMGQTYAQNQLSIFQRFTSRLMDIWLDVIHNSPVHGPSAHEIKYPHEYLQLLRTLINSYALTFLRKSAILLHVRYEVDFPNTGFSEFEEPEITRLTNALRLPSLDEIFESFVSSELDTIIT